MRRTYAAIVLATTLAIAGCSDAVTGTGKSGSSQPTPSGSSSGPSAPATSEAPSSSGAPSSAGGGDFPTDLNALGALMLHGGQTIKSAHLSLAESAGGTDVVASGDESLADGKVVAIDLAETVGTTKLRFIIVNGKVYAQLPANVYPATMPWVEISSSTTNSALQRLYSSFQSSIQTGTGDTVRLFVTAAKSLELKGTEQLDGATVGHYAMSVDVASLPADFPNLDALKQSGLKLIPIELYVDTEGRTRKVTEDFTVAGQHVTVEVTLTKINEPVHITAPPAAEVEVA